MPESANDNAASKASHSGMTLQFLESASFWANVAVVVFTVLAAIAGVFALYFASRLSVAKDADLDRFKTESAKVIASADARAAEANKKAAEAGEGTAKALSGAAEANERASRLELESLHQRERAAKAEKELLELQERIRHRSITAEQRGRLIAVLRDLPKGQVSVTCVLGDGEGLAFANQVVDVLKSAGWPVDGTNQGAFAPNNPVGFFVRVRNAANAPAHAHALLEAFNSVGIKLDGAQNPALDEKTVEIVVGNKP